MTSRWIRWLAVLAILLVVYAAAGFLGVPALVRWQVPRLAAAQLDRPASVGEVRFNPFTLRLQLHDLRLDEADHSPLFAVRGIDADLDWRSLVQRAWTLRHVRIDGPQAHLDIARDGRFNVRALMDSLQRHRKPGNPKQGGGVPRVVIEEFALTQGRLDWDDRQVDTHAVLAPIDLSFSRLSTLPNDKDAWRLAADVAGGGRVQWRGEGSLQPIRASGEIVLQDLPLPALAPYLKPYARIAVASGRLSATLPYEVAYDAGKLDAKLHAARLAIADLAAAREGSSRHFATLREAEVREVEADLVRREAVVGAVRVAGGELGFRRDARGTWDLSQLLVERQSPAPAGPPAPWKVAVRQVQVAQVALRVLDESVKPSLTLMAERIGGQVRVDASQTAEALALEANDGALQVEQLTVAQAGQPPLTLERLGVEKVAVDLAKRHVEAGRIAAEGGKLRVVRDAQGRIDLASLLPQATATPAKAQGPAWTARVAQVALSRIAVDVEDQGSGIRAQVQDLALRVDGAGTDLAQPLRVEGGLRLREGGQLALQGQVVPASRSVDAQVQLHKLALATAQPLLARVLRLKLTSGTLDTQGRLQASFAEGKAPDVRYTGRAGIADLRLDEADGKTLFARWKDVAADRLTVGTRGLEVPELRVAGAETSLIINEDRTFNAARLLVRQPAKPGARATPAAAPRGGDPFPVRIQRVRLQDARLDFQDRSLRPQFGARVYALNGVVTGLSSQRDSRSQVQLDGRVDQYGLARVRGALNAFAPRDSTDLDVVFRNIDMVPASPYAMKFAGYRIAEGRISLDLRYRVHDSQLVGDNKIVIDQLKLGERVDSPDALKLPLELAIALLKDGEGRIDLGVPVTGDLSDPQFSYGAVIWKALGNVLARAVTAPFRALASMFGGSGEKLGAVQFDPGSAKVLPPEREQLARVAEMLAKRPQLRVSVPAQYSEAADGAALRARAVRGEIARRAGQRPQPGEAPGPLDFTDASVRNAVRALYTQRFGEQGWEQAKAAAQTARPPGEASGASGTPDMSVPVWRRLSNFVQGEPQVADAAGFYRGLARKLEQDAPLPPDALATLGEQRARAVVAALTEAGVDPSRASTAAPAKVAGEPGKQVPLTLELAARR